MKTHTPPRLTPAEKQVAILVCLQLANKEIAQRLGKSVATVVSQLKKIMEKAGLKSRTGIALLAVKMGLVDIETLELWID